MAETSTADDRRLNRRAAIASLAIAATLALAKLAAWLITGSIAILTSLVDSGIDLLASLVTFVSLRQAAQPADTAHRYGHGKAEPLGAFAQAGFVAGSALILASESVQRLIAPQPISQGRLGIAVMLAAMALTGLLVLYQSAVVRRTGSIAIRADPPLADRITKAEDDAGASIASAWTGFEGRPAEVRAGIRSGQLPTVKRSLALARRGREEDARSSSDEPRFL